MKKCLLIVDMQYDFMEGGPLAVAGGLSLIPNIQKITTEYDNIFSTQDFHPKNHIGFASSHNMTPFTQKDGEMLWPDHCIENTKGAQIVAELDNCIPQKNKYLKGLYKTNGYSIGEHAEFMNMIKQFDQVDICGVAFDYCVKSSAISIVKNVKHTRVLTKLCKSVNPQDDAKFRTELISAGVELID
ncbi:Pyrazinamidase/nicotinamidase [Hexamita inflata]|uniref:nicotinamidase n=1 Tax=Hexamita inflata TaxID=28002 RepID=A0ABP1KYB3_9EUKA